MTMTATSPRLMTGVPTGFLSPQIPPPNQFVTTVGIEIEPGLGISVDGKAILVGPKNATETVDIVGRLADGTYPNRDFVVSRKELAAVVDGYYEHQDYKLDQQGQQLQVTGKSDLESYQANFRDNGFDIKSKYAGRSYQVDIAGSEATVKPGWSEGRHYKITQEGNKTVVDAGHEDLNFTFVRNSDGSIAIDGKLLTQDFTIKKDGEALVLQGYYPQQKYVIKKRN